MANPHGVPGIKLFGTTIKLQEQGAEDRVKEDDGDDQDQEAKRPEKIIACPRCKSMETKFCYFNNYNVNQPRHFCKGCQRYWTAGGALRNVPVGAGRRKAKPPCRDQLLEGCVYDAAGVQGFDLWEDWHVAAAALQGGFRHDFPVKRRRNDSGGHQSS